VKHQLKKLKDCKRLLSVEVDGRRIEARFGEVLEEFRKRARLKGYREGKAPLDLVETTYREEVNEEVTRTLVSEAYHACLREANLAPVTAPVIRDLKLERGKRLAFSVEFEVRPDFSLRNVRGLKAVRPPRDVSDAEVERTLASLRESRAELVPVSLVRPAMEGDAVRCDIEIYKEGAWAPADRDVVLPLERDRLQPDFLEQILGAQPDEVREIQQDLSPEEKAQGLVGRKPYLRVTVKELKAKQLPELDDAFASSFGKENLEALRRDVREELLRIREAQGREAMREQIFAELLRLHDFEPPEGLVGRRVKQILEELGPSTNGAARPEREAEARERAKRDIRLYFILERIAEKEKFTADPAVVEERVKRLAAETRHSEDEVREHFGADIAESLRQARTVEFLIENASVTEEKTDPPSSAEKEKRK
jgi:trigger factor